jgi:hypothetical protein
MLCWVTVVLQDITSSAHSLDLTDVIKINSLFLCVHVQKLYALPTVYLCVLYGSQNKEQLYLVTVLADWFL